MMGQASYERLSTSSADVRHAKASVPISSASATASGVPVRLIISMNYIEEERATSVCRVLLRRFSACNRLMNYKHGRW